LRNPIGNVVGFPKVVRDLTERKFAEESLRKANEMLEERVRSRTYELELRVRELEGFTSTVAHDLRAPLRSVHRYAELMLDPRNPPLDAQEVESLNRIVEATQGMDSLIEHLLTYSRLAEQRLTVRALDLENMVKEVLDGLALQIRDLGAKVDVENPLPKVLGDPTVLSQALTNLVSNALKFVADKGTPHVRIRAIRRGHSVRIGVEDNGIGIASQYLDRIFLPFERLHGPDAFPGSGLGLAIVKKAAERMGGAVGVESVPGQGSRFWLELPSPEAR